MENRSLKKFVEFASVTDPFLQRNGSADHDGSFEMARRLKEFAPKIARMMEIIVRDDRKRSDGPHSLPNKSDRAALLRRFKYHEAGTDKPPLSHLGIHFVFLPTEDGDRLFDGEKDDKGRLSCRGDPDTGPEAGRKCLGTLAYAMRAYGIRVITTNPRVKVGVDLEKDRYFELLGITSKSDPKTMALLKEATSRDLRNKGATSKVEAVHKIFKDTLNDSLMTLKKVLEYDQGDDIDVPTCQRVCKALGGVPAGRTVLEKVAQAMKKEKLQCLWKRKIREFPKQVLNYFNSNGGKHYLLERYRGMLDARNNKAALQFFLEVIHRGTLDANALDNGRILVKHPEVACNYKRAILFTSPVVAEDDVKGLFVEPLNQDGLLVRFIAVHLPRAVGLNIKPADVIHKPDVPVDDGNDIQSSARALRACPFHINNLSECIAEQVGDVHRRCYTANNLVQRRDYLFSGEETLQRLDEQRKGQNVLRDVMAGYAADCVDHSRLHMRIAENGRKDPDSVLDFKTNDGRTVAACYSGRKIHETPVVRKKYSGYPFLELMEFLPLTTPEFCFILLSHARDRNFDKMINRLDASGNAVAMVKRVLGAMRGDALQGEDESTETHLANVLASMAQSGKIDDLRKLIQKRPDRRRDVNITMSNTFGLSVPSYGSNAHGDNFLIDAFTRMVAPHGAGGRRLEATNEQGCRALQTTASSPMSVTSANGSASSKRGSASSKRGSANSNRGSAAKNNNGTGGDVDARRCVYLYTWRFLSELLRHYLTTVIHLLQSRANAADAVGATRRELFKLVFTYTGDMLRVARSSHVSDKTMLDRIRLFDGAKEYIKESCKQPESRMAKLFKLMSDRSLNDPKRLLDHAQSNNSNEGALIRDSTESVGQMFVASVFMLRARVGLPSTICRTGSKATGSANSVPNSMGSAETVIATSRRGSSNNNNNNQGGLASLFKGINGTSANNNNNQRKSTVSMNTSSGGGNNRNSGGKKKSVSARTRNTTRNMNSILRSRAARIQAHVDNANNGSSNNGAKRRRASSRSGKKRKADNLVAPTLRPDRNRTIGRAVRPRVKLLDDENDAQELINDFTLHWVKKGKDPLEIMKKIKRLGPQDIRLVHEVLNEDPPYKSTMNRDRLKQAEGEEAKRRVRNQITSERFINSQKDRLRQILSMRLSGLTNNQLKKMFTVPLDALNNSNNYDVNNISVKEAFQILGIDSKDATMRDARKARKRIAMGEDRRYIGHPNQAAISNKNDATKEMQRVLAAFEVVTNYIERRDKAKSVPKPKEGVQKTIKKAKLNLKKGLKLRTS